MSVTSRSYVLSIREFERNYPPSKIKECVNRATGWEATVLTNCLTKIVQLGGLETFAHSDEGAAVDFMERIRHLAGGN